MSMDLRTGVTRRTKELHGRCPCARPATGAGALAAGTRECCASIASVRRTLREVFSDALVSLGYLSEVERGQKEASSELLSSICTALNVPLSHVLRLVADRIDFSQGRVPAHMRVPDSVHDELVRAEMSKLRR